MEVIVVAELQVNSGVVEPFLASLAQRLVETRAFEGCEELIACRDADDPDRIVLVERWASAGAHQSYLAWRAATGSVAETTDMLSAPIKISYLQPQPGI
jgi:quinol monooxygenase YgiN